MPPLLPLYEPTQHISANPNLYVSAESPYYNNYFAGPQVIEVIVMDPDISRLDQSYGEPVVTVNAKRLRMAQATDGNWYGYFADSTQAQTADATQKFSTLPVSSGLGLDFGKFCSSATSNIASGVDFSETKGIAVARDGATLGGSDGMQNSVNINTSCGGPSDTTVPSVTGKNANLLNHVVRQNKTLNTNAPGGRTGQIAGNNLAFEAAWPVIQLFDFSAIPSTVIVQYDKAGGSQIVNLVFDRIPSNAIHVLSNRYDFPRGAQAQLDLVDPQLNIDPTEEDSWTWGSSPVNNTTFYQVFDRSGNYDADGTRGMQNLSGNLTSLMFNHNGKLRFDFANGAIATLQSNGIQTLTPDPSLPYPLNTLELRTQSISGRSLPITVAEVQPNVGIFGGYDNGGISDVRILDKAPREKSLSITYNDIANSLVVKFHTATLTMG